MNIQTPLLPSQKIVYPDSDGKPMADNTLQFEWIVTIKCGLEALFWDNPEVFVAGDLLWYPVERKSDISAAPDVLVVFGRPKGYRGSYKQWEENDIPPQVVFEILSPGNTSEEMAEKLEFYQQYGVEEYYLINPYLMRINGWRRVGQELKNIPEMNGWVSPRLKVRFDLVERELKIIRPDNRPFATYVELEKRTERLAAQLRALGVEPEF